VSPIARDLEGCGQVCWLHLEARKALEVNDDRKDGPGYLRNTGTPRKKMQKMGNLPGL
jgi:hypothetical protein